MNSVKQKQKIEFWKTRKIDWFTLRCCL